MIEQRDMWVVESNLSIKPIVAVYDTEKQQPTAYRYASRTSTKAFPYSVGDYQQERYFATEGEAVNWRNEKVKRLREMMPRVKEFVDEMNNIGNDNEFLPHKNEDYGWPDDEDDDDGYYDDYEKYKAAFLLLADAMKTGFLNVCAETVRLSEVVGIEWDQERWKKKDADGDEYEKSRDRATLCLRDGKKLQTLKEYERLAVEAIFGENRSGRVFVKNIQPPKEDDED